jgi:hypothetical protein
VIRPATGGRAVAWYSASLDHLTPNPLGRGWAGSTDKHLELIRLEGKF